jgi:hypothetical protein
MSIRVWLAVLRELERQEREERRDQWRRAVGSVAVVVLLALIATICAGSDRPRAPLPRAPQFTAPDSRTTPTNDVPTPPRPVVRESASKSIVYVVGSTTCGACQVFERNHGKGDATTEYRYVKLDRQRTADIDVATWNQCVNFSNSGKFLYPFFVAKIGNEYIAVQARVEK